MPAGGYFTAHNGGKNCDDGLDPKECGTVEQREPGQPRHADRMLAVESPSEAEATFSEFAQAVRGVVRRQDILVCETGTRAWIIARDTGRAGAQALESRISTAVRDRQPWRQGCSRCRRPRRR